MQSSPFNRWWTVAAGALGAGFGVGIFLIYVLGVLIKPMAADLGIDRSVVSFATTAFLVTNAIGTISLGVLMHRFGVPRPAFVYLAVTVLGIAIIPLLPPTPALFYVLFGLLGIAGAASTPFPYTVAVTGLFDRGRGLALATVVLGAGVAGILGSQLTKILEVSLGWRGTIWVIAAVMAIPLLTLAVIVRSPKGVTRSAGTADKASHWELYLGKRAFWLIAPPIGAIAAGAFILTILAPMMSDRGIPPGQAADMLSFSAVASLVSRLGVGWLMDRLWAPLVASLVCAMAAAGVLVVLFGGASVPLAILGACLLGMALGAEADLLTYLCSRYFKLEAFSRVVGSMWLLWAWGGGIATAAAGMAFRSTGSYEPALWVLAVLLLISAGVVLLLGPYTYPPSHGETSDASRDRPASAH